MTIMIKPRAIMNRIVWSFSPKQATSFNFSEDLPRYGDNFRGAEKNR